MWRSGMFWQFFLVTGGLLVVAVLIAGFLIVHSFPQHAAGIEGTEAASFQLQVWLTVGIIGVVGVLLAFWLTRRMIEPLYQLAQSARQIAAGEYGRKVLAVGSSEVGILAQSFNYTSERLAAQFVQIDEDRQQLRAVLSSMVEGVVAIDAKQKILFANDRAARLLDFDSQNAVGRPLREVIRQRAIHESADAVLSSGQMHSQELNWHGPQSRSLALHTNPLPGTPPRGAVLVLHDTTELRRLERLRQEFVANVSHELKTPLAVITANVETLLDGAIDDIDHREVFLQRISDQAENLHRLILDLLSLARIESGAESFVFQAVDIDVIVQNCLQHHHTLAEEKKQILEIMGPEETVTVWGDEEAVSQILDNLVDNAIKYTPEGGRITIRWYQNGDQVCLEVADTGLGIPQKELPRIFERFYRVDKTRSRQLGGTGLGLSIVKHLVQSMNGSVHAESEINKGCTFAVRLPCHEVSGRTELIPFSAAAAASPRTE